MSNATATATHPTLTISDECPSCFGSGSERVGWEDETCCRCHGSGVYYEAALDLGDGDGDYEPIAEAGSLRNLRSEMRAWALEQGHGGYTVKYEGEMVEHLGTKTVKVRRTFAERQLQGRVRELIDEVKNLKVAKGFEPGGGMPAILREGVLTATAITNLYNWWNGSRIRHVPLVAECKRALIERTLRLAALRNWKVSRKYDGNAKHPLYPFVVYVETPWGQCSWHVGTGEFTDIADNGIEWSRIRNSEQVLALVYSIPENQSPLEA